MIEDKIWNSNPSTYIIGSDEVGRGSFAGPIGAASVRINYEHIDLLIDVKDSKKLSPKKRYQIFELVQESEIEYSYVERDNKFIDLYGIKLANEKVLEDSISSIFQDGDIVYVDIDTEGENVEKENIFGTIEAVKTVSDLFMPISGTVSEKNNKLEDNPQLINESPYEEGWIIKIQDANLDQLNDLLSAEEYKKEIGI